MSETKTLFLLFAFGWFCSDVNSYWSARMSNVLRDNQLPINTSVKETLGTGVQLAIDHCQKQFKWDPWNCPENIFSHGNKGWGSTRELAYVLAITSAAVDYVVTKNCSAGHIRGCGCNPDLNGQKEEDFVWGGCSDFPDYGEKISKRFLDEAELGMDAHTFTNLHNYAVGREVVRKSMKKHCKCHGMSGSCTLKSCWLQLPPFDYIAEQLRYKYDRAIRIPSTSLVDVSEVLTDVPDIKALRCEVLCLKVMIYVILARIDFDYEGRYAVGNSVSGNTLSGISKPKTKNLIYIQRSPNYCRENDTTGWKGTKGRSCSRRKGEGVTGPEKKSCLNLCKKCGHKVKKTERKVERHCNCSFKWCCEVKCERCTESVTEHFCS